MKPSSQEPPVITLLADVHYTFSPPAQSPPHHRFKKASHVHLYQPTPTGPARLEIVNSPGTSDQDAVAGSLDTTASLSHSPTHPCLIDLTINAQPQPQTQWHLPAFDPRNERKYLYPLHAIALYFYHPECAHDFLSILHPRTPTQTSITPTTSPAQTQKDFASTPQLISHSHQSSLTSMTNTPAATTPPTFNPSPRALPTQPVPLIQPYNPAAPGTPERIAARSKTPPPPLTEDEGSVAVIMNGNATIVREDGQMQIQYQHPPQQQSQQQRHNSFTPHQYQAIHYYTPPYQSSQNAGSPTQAPYRTPITPHLPDQLQTQTPSQSIPSYHQPTPQRQQQLPPNHQIHAQFYSPDPAEFDANSSAWLKTQAQGGSQGQVQGQQVRVKQDRLEKGVNRLLRRLDGVW